MIFLRFLYFMIYLIMKKMLLFVLIIVPIIISSQGNTSFRKKIYFLQDNLPNYNIKAIKKGNIYALSRNSVEYYGVFSDNYSNASGYSGKISVLLIITKDLKTLKKIYIYKSNETPPFLNRVIFSHFFDNFKDKNIMSILRNNNSVDSVSGCTYTSKGIYNTVRETLSKIKKEKLLKKKLDIIQLLGMIMFYILLLFIIIKPSKWLVLLMYIAYFLLFILYLKFTLSMEFIIRELIYFKITTASIFLVVIFFIAIFKKNYFCTTMCPVSFLTFLSMKIKTKKIVIKKNLYSRSVYFIIAFFFALQNITYLVVFPFIYFLPPYNIIKIAFIFVFFIISIFIPRFWCNTLCPLGFFLDRFGIKHS